MAGIQWFDLIDTRTLTTTFISITSVGGDISHFEAGLKLLDKYAKDGKGISCSYITSLKNSTAMATS